MYTILYSNVFHLSTLLIGLSAAQVEDLNIKKRALEVDGEIIVQQNKASKVQGRKNRFDMYEKLISLGPSLIGQDRYNSSVNKMFDIVEQLDKDSEDEATPNKKVNESVSSVSTHSMNDDSFADDIRDNQ